MKNSKNKKGFFSLVLHSHLPYVLNHGEWPHGVYWLYEAASETYLPLIKVFLRLIGEGISPQVTIGVTPVLVEQLNSSVFKKEFKKYLEERREAALRDERDFAKTGFKKRVLLARFWVEFYESNLQFFKSINEDIPGTLSVMAKEGHIELITSAATHAYLPLLKRDESIKGQLVEGLRSFKEIFGISPKGIWPPELGYRPAYKWRLPVGSESYKRRGLEEFYKELGFSYFLTDFHLLSGGEGIGTYLSRSPSLKFFWEQFRSQAKGFEKRGLTPYLPYSIFSESGKGVSFFTRDPRTALQVWSKDHGYPGDPAYLEFHKKSFESGHRYWRVTGSEKDLAEKDEYDLQMARIPLENQSNHFVELLNNVMDEFHKEFEIPGIIVSPYDAELFGHWWFEGPEWLYLVLKKLNQTDIKAITLNEYLKRFPSFIEVSLPEGSWGEGGFHWVWLNENTEWVWKHIYEAEDLFFEVLNIRGENLKEGIFQLARELLLLESSDWTFLITTWSAKNYGEKRVVLHFERFMKLYNLLKDRKREELKRYLDEVGKKDALLPEIDPFEWKM